MIIRSDKNRRSSIDDIKPNNSEQTSTISIAHIVKVQPWNIVSMAQPDFMSEQNSRTNRLMTGSYILDCN